MDSKQQLVEYLYQHQFIKNFPESNLYLGQPEGALLLLEKNNICSEVDAIEFLLSQLNLNWARPLQELETNSTEIKSLVELAGNDFCWRYKLIPFKQTDEQVLVACNNPFLEEPKRLLEFSFQKKVVLHLCREKELVESLLKVHPRNVISYDSLLDAAPGSLVEILSLDQKSYDVEEHVDAPPIIRLCNKIIADALQHDASDIHLEPQEDGLIVKFRILGTITSIFEIPSRLKPYVITRFKILSDMDISERRRPQDGRIRARVGDIVADVRVSSIPTAHGEKLVFRLLNPKAYQQSFESLGLTGRLKNNLIQALSQKGRMILVTGPTGSGKSTTLYTCLNHLRDGTINIETVEDPIEYRIAGISQIQVNEASGITFSAALRSILRQDPDVIMIGEIRDTETAEIALQAAQTGHLVLSTLHTNDAISTIRRLEQLNCSPYLIASNIGAIIAQRLVRTNCPACARYLKNEEKEKIAEYSQKYGMIIDLASVQKGSGCPKCFFSGYASRTAIYSFLDFDSQVEELVVQNSSLNQVLSYAKSVGFEELWVPALNMLNNGQTSFEEVAGYLMTNNEFPNSEVIPLEARQPTSHKPVHTEKKLAKQKILLVEDDEGVRSVLSLLLEKEMFTVIEAENGQKALEKVYSDNPTIILCDLMMPVMDGRDFLIRMKNNSQTANIPILILTAADDDANETDLLELGADDFISKASSSNVMLARIRKLVSQN